MVDPLGHSGAHWEARSQGDETNGNCSACNAPAVAANSRTDERYCEQCYTTDAARLLEFQFSFHHPPVKKEDLKRMRASLGATNLQIRKWLKTIQYP